jgi:hypothetical protein
MAVEKSGATSSPIRETGTAKTAALPTHGDDRQSGPAGLDNTITSTTGSAETKSGPGDGKITASSAAGVPTAESKASLPPAAASNIPRPGDRTFVGQPKPRDPAEIGLGSVVLAHEGPEDGWWEAEVIGINGRVFSLRWRDYPTQPTILRKASELALLPPGEP